MNRPLERLKKYCSHAEREFLGFGEALAKEQVQSNPVTEPKRSQNSKRPLPPLPFPRGYSIFQNALVLLFVLCLPNPLLACTVCYGQTDSPMQQGMSWGILTLLTILAAVLAAISMFFVFLCRREAAAPVAQTIEMPNSTH